MLAELIVFFVCLGESSVKVNFTKYQFLNCKFQYHFSQEINKFIKEMRKKGLNLPDNFAQSILDYDIQIVLADEPKSQVITKITQLYTLGMQYYESIKSYKYIYFQKKINELFMLLQKKSQKNSSPPKKIDKQTRVSLPKSVVNNQLNSPLKKKLLNGSDQQKLQALLIKQQQQKMQTKIDTSISNTDIQVHNLLNSREEKLSTFDSIISKQMNLQNSKLQNRLAMRKKNSTNTKLTRKTNSTITQKNLFNIVSMDQEKEENSQSTYYYRGSYEGSQQSDRRLHDLINYNAILIQDHLSNNLDSLEQGEIKIDFLQECKEKNTKQKISTQKAIQSQDMKSNQNPINNRIKQRIFQQKSTNQKNIHKNAFINLFEITQTGSCSQTFESSNQRQQKQQIANNQLEPIIQTITQNNKDQSQTNQLKNSLTKMVTLDLVIPYKKQLFTSQAQDSLLAIPSKTKGPQKYTKILKKSKKNKTQF